MRAADLEQMRLPRSLTVHHTAPLESPWIWRILLAATVLCVAFLIWHTIRRRRRGIHRSAVRRWSTRLAASVSVVVLLLSTGLAFLNTYVGYLPTAASLRNVVLGGSSVPGSNAIGSLRYGTAQQAALRAGDSMVVSARIGAPRLDIPSRDAFIYLPPGYGLPANAHRRYPVVYLLAGFPGRPADWMLAGGVPQAMTSLIEHRQVGPMIVVAPDPDGGFEHDSECLNQVDGPQIATYLTRTVVHYIDAHFRTLRERAGRAVGGMSSGGYCAVNLALRNQNVFSNIVAFEPYGTPGRSVIGPILRGSQVLYRENSPEYYLPTMHFTRHFYAFMDAGAESASEIARVRALADQLAARGQTVAFRAEPSQTHTWKEASAGLPYGLYFAAHHLRDGMLLGARSQRAIVTFGHPLQKQADGFIKRYARQQAFCRRFGPQYRPVGGAHSMSCAARKVVRG